MTFNSFVFIEFALIFFAGWSLFRSRRQFAYIYLIVASCLFYGYATWWFVPVLLATGTFDFYIAQFISKFPERKKPLLILSCVSNLSVLFLFKYIGFSADIVNSVASRLSLPISLPVLHLILPIGISFYTFQSLSYIFDVYNGKIEPTKRLSHFLAIVSLFAHLVAGPIVRVSHILPQIEELKKPSVGEIWIGLDLVAVGLFKKMVLADNLAPVVDRIYGSNEFTGATAVLACVAFSFQIYYDFSGYTDIARGIARWLGLDFGVNFNHPYAALGIADFWSRWHISLSLWIRDYIYIPLGGNRKGEARAHLNLWIAFLLSGLWHGASFTFILWGGLHAALQSIERLTKWPARLTDSGRLGRVATWVITFAIVSLAWIPFRAVSFGQMMAIVNSLTHFWSGWGSPDIHSLLIRSSIVVPSLAYEGWVVFGRRRIVTSGNGSVWSHAVRNGILLASCVLLAPPSKTFIYFQF